jgi:hypothetical protein
MEDPSDGAGKETKGENDPKEAFHRDLKRRA